MKIKLIFVFIILSFSTLSQNQTTKEYIEKWKDEAIIQMKSHKIPASITLAQGILESGNGNSKLATNAKNHFGIKCHKKWKGKTFYQDDDEKDECFRKYENAKESFKDHSIFLQKTRYKGLFKLEITDYKGWAKGLKKAGYATNPRYPDLLIRLVERYNLTQYDIKKELIVKSRPEKAEIKKEIILVKKEGVSDEPEPETIVISIKRKTGETKNEVPFVIAKKGDSYEKLGKELDIWQWQLRKYNDLTKNHVFKDGERIFIKPKRCKSKEEFHYAKKGENLRDISQLYGVKLSKLYKRNKMSESDSLTLGQKVYLRKSKK